MHVHLAFCSFQPLLQQLRIGFCSLPCSLLSPFGCVQPLLCSMPPGVSAQYQDIRAIAAMIPHASAEDAYDSEAATVRI